MSYSSLEYEVADGRAWITLNRPEVLNAINAEMRDEIIDVMRDAGATESVRVIVIRGAGDRAFCAGADVREFTQPESAVRERGRRHEKAWHRHIAECPKPVIAAIHGYCLGGGLEMALACDLRIAGESAVFGLPELSLGLIPGAGGTQRLTRTVGLSRTLELILTGERISASRALEIGLVTRLVEDERLSDEVMEFSDRLRQMAPIAVRYAKEAILRGYELSLDDGLRLEADLASLLTTTSDRREGVAAFQERRSPAFRGE